MWSFWYDNDGQLLQSNTTQLCFLFIKGTVLACDPLRTSHLAGPVDSQSKHPAPELGQAYLHAEAMLFSGHGT